MSFSILRSQLKYEPISYRSNACCMYHPSHSDHLHYPNDFLWNDIHETPRCAIFYRLYVCKNICMYVCMYVFFLCCFSVHHTTIWMHQAGVSHSNRMYVCLCVYIYSWKRDSVVGIVTSLWTGIEESVFDFWRPCNAVVRNTSCCLLLCAFMECTGITLRLHAYGKKNNFMRPNCIKKWRMTERKE